MNLRFKHYMVRGWRQFAGRPSMRVVNEFLFDCAIHGLGILNYENDHVSGEHEFVNKFLSMYLGNCEQPVLIDVGANCGRYSSMLVKTFPHAKVIACEANPKTAVRLRERFGDDSVTIVERAIGAENGSIRFFDRLDRDGTSEHGSIYKEVIEKIHGVTSVEYAVPMATIDQLVQDHQLSTVQLLKVDTEGHELEVLKGARRSLAAGAIDLLHLEFGELNLISRVFFRDLALQLEDYVAFRLLPHGAIRLKDSTLKREIFAYQNVVFVHKRFAPNHYMIPQNNLKSLPGTNSSRWQRAA